MKPSCTVLIHTPQELNHSSYIQTGLFELEHMGVITVKVKLSFKRNLGFLTVTKDGIITKKERPHSKTSFYTLIDHTTNKKITFAADLYDHAPHFSGVALKECDFYFKRNYESRFVKGIKAEANAKVKKLGIVFGSLSENRRSRGKFKTGLFVTNLSLNLKWDRNPVKRLLKSYGFQKHHWNFTNAARTIARFENFENATTDTIMFQTRCFLHEKDKDLQEIHQQRYRIIKLLRKNFSDTFEGGFVPSTLAKTTYGDALTNVPTQPEEYLDAMKKARIVIYTRGLANSPAWKMAEYLSQGKIIIAEPLTAELPVPLTEGKELLYFKTDSELIEKIKLVLDTPALGEELSKNARAYFETHVHPVQNTKRILELMLNRSLEKS
ncbi:glycosyltransferase [Rasiella sp. SM2506]|uniref:glycosyltransferase n=1 Tax=Rasiella sp. SM2506 TaxID=3423914 RepID=UPI003D799CDC